MLRVSLWPYWASFISSLFLLWYFLTGIAADPMLLGTQTEAAAERQRARLSSYTDAHWFKRSNLGFIIHSTDQIHRFVLIRRITWYDAYRNSEIYDGIYPFPYKISSWATRIIIIIIIIITAIEFSFGGSSPCTCSGKTKKNKCAWTKQHKKTQYKQYKTQQIQKHILPKHPHTCQNTHTYTHPHITKSTHTHTHTLQNPHIHTPTH